VRHLSLGDSASRSVGELERYSPSPGPLFVGPPRSRADPIRLTRFGADHLLKQAAAAAGIKRPVSANVLRRTHVTAAQRAGVPIEEIRQHMGHRDVRTTRRYLTPTDDKPHLKGAR
jgi:integrase